MAALIRHRTPGMTTSRHDEISPPLLEKLKTQPGFMYHVAFMDKGVFTVSEIWESEEGCVTCATDAMCPCAHSRKPGFPSAV